MKVQVNRISNSVPFVVEDEVSVESFNAFMADNEEECFAKSPVAYKASIKHKKTGLLLEATIHAEIWIDCVRCNQRDESTLDLSTTVLLVDSSNSPKDDEIILGEDDLDVSFFQGNELDVDHIILESIWADLDSNHLCKDDCRGLCPSCGKNLNDGDCSCKHQS